MNSVKIASKKFTPPKLLPPWLTEAASLFKDYIINSAVYASNTKPAYLSDLNDFLISCEKVYQLTPHLTHEKLLTSSALYAQKNLWVHLKSNSKIRKVALLKVFFNFLFHQKIIENSLSHQLIAPKKIQSLPRFLSVDEALNVLKYVQKLYFSDPHQLEAVSPPSPFFSPSPSPSSSSSSSSSQSPRPSPSQNATPTPTQNLVTTKAGLIHAQSYLLFILTYTLGLRVSEAINLKWTDFDESMRYVTILGKGGHYRQVALLLPVSDFLTSYKNLNSLSALVVPRPISSQKAYTLMKDLGFKAGLNKIMNPHSLRHSYATHLLSNGANLKVLQELLGHKTLVTTQKYTHLDFQHLSQTIDKMHPLSKK